MITINKSDNIGNTFIGLVMTAFNLREQSKIRIDPMMQYGSCGTVVVNSESYDWFDNGVSIKFIPSV